MGVRVLIILIRKLGTLPKAINAGLDAVEIRIRIESMRCWYLLKIARNYERFATIYLSLNLEIEQTEI